MALQQSFLAAAGLNYARTAASRFRARSEGSSRIFRGAAGQVAAVRRFVRAEAGGHPAADDAELIASELAANAVAHTASGRADGLFAVHVTAVSAACVAVLVTDQGSLAEPMPQHAGTEAESGRGLDLVTALASVFISFGDDTGRTVLAIAGQTADACRQPGNQDRHMLSNTLAAVSPAD